MTNLYAVGGRGCLARHGTEGGDAHPSPYNVVHSLDPSPGFPRLKFYIYSHSSSNDLAGPSTQTVPGSPRNKGTRIS